MLKNKLSVCLATYNEEKNIEKCLRSVKYFVDEIIVVDGSSTDKTAAIAKKYCDRVIITTNKPMFHINKQIALNNAKSDWILQLDADEEVSKELAKEIQLTINRQLTINGYWLPRKNIIFGKWIQHTGWYPDYQLRLFKKGKAKLPCSSIHEQPILIGKSGKLENSLIHHNYQSISQFIKRLDLYTENDKKLYLKDNKKITWHDFLEKPIDEFIKRFLDWEGYKDGIHGLSLSLLQAFYQLVVVLKVWEENDFYQEIPERLNDEALLTIRNKEKEYVWWQKELLIQKEKNHFLKLIRKLIRKLS